jgi:hypothetical protein
MDEVLTMAQREIDKLHVIRKVLARELSWTEGAQQLRLSARQVGRLCARVRVQGAKGVIHGLRGRPSNRGFDAERMERVIGILHDPLWNNFGPTFARDKLAELHGILVSDETLRRWMMKAGLWRAWHGPKRHRAWRERRPRVGMMVQLDGSEHAWFEDRGPRCTLVLYIDDATSRILHGEFAESEDTLTLMRTTKAYLERYGRPVCYYVDKDSIYKVNLAAKWERDAKLPEPLTQFTRAMTELGIEVQCAHSPQAKGRVERSFKTHQDRLVKELRLAGISSIAEANRFLWDKYIPVHNRRYSVAPGEAVDAHRPLLPGHRLEEVLSLRVERTVQNDFIVQYGGRFLQILASRAAHPRPRDKVLVESRLDGSTHLRHGDRCLAFQALGSRPYRPKYQECYPSKAEVRHIDAASEQAKISVARRHYLRRTGKGRLSRGRFTMEGLDLKYGFDAYEAVGLGQT